MTEHVGGEFNRLEKYIEQAAREGKELHVHIHTDGPVDMSNRTYEMPPEEALDAETRAMVARIGADARQAIESQSVATRTLIKRATGALVVGLAAVIGLLVWVGLQERRHYEVTYPHIQNVLDYAASRFDRLDDAVERRSARDDER